MGWKSTKQISRTEALSLIIGHIAESSNDELGNILETLGFGEKSELKYLGYNFDVRDTVENNSEQDMDDVNGDED